MKKQKPNHRIPWWSFDPQEKPPTKGWWKIFQRRKERRYWLCKIQELYNDE